MSGTDATPTEGVTEDATGDGQRGPKIAQRRHARLRDSGGRTLTLVPEGPARMRDLLGQRGLSHAALADRVGVNKSMVGHLLSGYRDTVAETLATAIAEALQVGRDYLFTPESPTVSRADDHVTVGG